MKLAPFFVLFAAAALIGCTSPRVQTSSPLTAVAPIAAEASGRPVTVIDAPEPGNLLITTVGHPEAAGGIESTLIYLGKMAGFGRLLTEAMKSESFRPGATVTDALGDALKRAGHSSARTALKRHERSEFVDDYGAPPGTQSGLLLDIVPVAVGYWNKFPDGPYRPWVVLAYREYDPAVRMVVSTGQIGTGPSIDGTPITSVAPDDQYTFASFDGITADPKRAVAGMRAAIRKVAQALTQKL